MSSPDPTRTLRLAVSQRVDLAPGHGERRDALAQDWYPVFERWNAVALPVPNRHDFDPTWLDIVDVDAVLLTGGNTPGVPGAEPGRDRAPERDSTERTLIARARTRGAPVLGVCRGAQMLASVFGARLRRVEPKGAHVATDHDVVLCTGDRLRVNSYHDWQIDPVGFPSELRIVARAADGSIEAFVHEHEPLAGVLWHPERPGPAPPRLDSLVRAALAGVAREEVDTWTTPTSVSDA
ncbi:MAG TPA: gamma-glutamyl-gamma-aminobutyrate hydrolase family protein [Candidatus Krumholzibacteria bacterium]|nr:gamma-glutamyl-gamma-aminobutyrate hydrolase family protein [Candidatus Krumholzibacteria bacterium]